MKPRVLLISGTDSSGGAGLGRDVATVTALGGEAALAVTAVTAQTDTAVQTIHHVPPDNVAAQIRAAGPVGAIKTGMLAGAATVGAVAEALPDAPLVVDPVLSSSSGRALIDPDGIRLLLGRIVPRATLLTPNLPEFGILTRQFALPADASEADGIRALLSSGCRAILLKGGHGPAGARCEDRLYLACAPDAPLRWTGPRHPVELRGTGCRLASAIAVGLARNLTLPRAIDRAREMLDRAFREKLARPDPTGDRATGDRATGD